MNQYGLLSLFRNLNLRGTSNPTQQPRLLPVPPFASQLPSTVTLPFTPADVSLTFPCAHCTAPVVSHGVQVIPYEDSYCPVNQSYRPLPPIPQANAPSSSPYVGPFTEQSPLCSSDDANSSPGQEYHTEDSSDFGTASDFDPEADTTCTGSEPDSIESFFDMSMVDVNAMSFPPELTAALERAQRQRRIYIIPPPGLEDAHLTSHSRPTFVPLSDEEVEEVMYVRSELTVANIAWDDNEYYNRVYGEDVPAEDSAITSCGHSSPYNSSENDADDSSH